MDNAKNAVYQRKTYSSSGGRLNLAFEQLNRLFDTVNEELIG
jgi:hypothetical protein